MSRVRPVLIPTLAAALAAASLAAAPAMASGGSGGGATSTPITTSGPTVYCTVDPVVDMGTYSVFWNQAGDAGCVYVRSYPNFGGLRLDHVGLTPGWTYVIKSNGEGTTSKVALRFTETATGRTVDFLTEYGKTKIA